MPDSMLRSHGFRRSLNQGIVCLFAAAFLIFWCARGAKKRVAGPHLGYVSVAFVRVWRCWIYDSYIELVG